MYQPVAKWTLVALNVLLTNLVHHKIGGFLADKQVCRCKQFVVTRGYLIISQSQIFQ